MFLFLPLEKTEAVWDNVGRIWMLCYCPGQTDLQVATSRYKFPTCIQLAFCLAIYLRGLAMTCIDFGWAQIRTQVAASFSPFGHPTQLKLSASQLYMCIREIYDCLWLAWTCWSIWPPIASLYTSLCWLSSTCESVWPALYSPQYMCEMFVWKIK